MELNVNDTVIAGPSAMDITRAFAATSFPEDWFAALDNGLGQVLGAVAQKDGRFAVTYDDGANHHTTVAEALDVKSMFAKFLAGNKDWQADGHWRQPSAVASSGTKPKFVKDTRPLLGRSGDGPPPWAIAAMIAVIGFVGLMVSDPGLARAIFPFAGSDFFWIGLIFLPIVALLAFAAAGRMIDMRRSRSWSVTTGTIVRSAIESRTIHFAGDVQDTVEKVAAVDYEFTAGGRKVIGSRIGIGDNYRGADAAAALTRYPAGQSVTVHYDPADPSNCVLERRGPDISRKDMTGCARESVALVLIGIGIWWAIAHGPAWLSARFPKSHPQAVLAATGFGVLVLMVFYAQLRTQKAAVMRADTVSPANAALQNPRANWILPVVALACFALAIWQFGIAR